MNRILLADLALIALNVLWGYCFIVIKQLLFEIPPFSMLAARFLFAAFLLLPFQIFALKHISPKELLYYFLCGLALGIGFILQTHGMVSTNPGKSGVITGTLVVFVPIIHFIWTGVRFSKHALFGTLLTFLGLCFVSLDGIQNFSEIKQGDFYLLAGAIMYALHVVLVDRIFSVVRNVKPMLLAMVQLFIVGFIGLSFSITLESMPISLSRFAIFGILFLSLFGSLLAYIVQMWAQKYSPSSHVGVLLSTEAVFACIFSYFIFDEQFTLFMWIGALLVLTGILLTQGFLSFRRNHVTKNI